MNTKVLLGIMAVCTSACSDTKAITYDLEFYIQHPAVLEEHVDRCRVNKKSPLSCDEVEAIAKQYTTLERRFQRLQEEYIYVSIVAEPEDSEEMRTAMNDLERLVILKEKHAPKTKTPP